MTLPSYWQQAWDEAEPRLREWSEAWRTGLKTIATPRVLRVGQLDAELLDEDLIQMLNEPIAKALNLINSAFRAKLEPELLLVIRLTLYKFSLWDLGATYGAKLQDLHYSVESLSGRSLATSGLPRRTLAAHAFLTILIPYFHSRFRSHALSHAWPDTPSSDRRRKAWNLMSKLESYHAAAALFGFVVFLWNGRYRTLADRILSMRLVSSKRLANRQVSYEFMNRQMVWHAFTEFLLLVLPLFGSRAFRRTYKQISVHLRNVHWSSVLPSSSPKALKTTPTVQKGKYFSLLAEQCAICADAASFNLSSLASDPSGFASTFTSRATRNESASEAEVGPPAYPLNSPYRASCGHEYCYFCLSEKLLRAVDDGDDGWECLRCKALIRSCDRVTAISIEEQERSDDEDSDIGTPSFASDMSFESLSSEQA